MQKLFDMLAADVSRPDLAATQKLFTADLDSELFLTAEAVLVIAFTPPPPSLQFRKKLF